MEHAAQAAKADSFERGRLSVGYLSTGACTGRSRWIDT